MGHQLMERPDTHGRYFLDRSTQLATLEKVGRRIINPAGKDVVSITPHLTPAQRQRALANQEGDAIFIAVPPVRVRGSFWVAALGSENGVHFLELSHYIRTPHSYEDGKSRDDIMHEVPFSDEAMAYALAHWGDQLTYDTWIDAGEVQLLDPTTPVTDRGSLFNGGPTHVLTMYYALNAPFKQITSGSEFPVDRAWDQALVDWTDNKIIGKELMGSRYVHVDFNCALCSGALNTFKCTNCGMAYKEKSIGIPARSALPTKLAEYAKSVGHVFREDPQGARSRERVIWHEQTQRAKIS